MSTRTRLLSVFTLVCFGTAASAADQQAHWRLREVLQLAAAKVEHDDTSVQSARLELQMLEALNKTRIEFRPQLSILSFSNPLFLAASIGGSFSINRRTAPTPVNMELARYAVVEAELGHAGRQIHAEIDATREFFALAAAQEGAVRSCNSWESRTKDRGELQDLITAKRITRLDAIRFEQDLATLESECLEGKAQVSSARSALVRLIGVDVAEEKFQVNVEELTPRFEPNSLAASDELVKAIFGSREQLKSISEQMANLSSPDAKRRLHFESLSAGYSYLGNAEKRVAGASNQYLLGGNVGHLDGGFYIPLRNTGDGAAAAAFLQARFDRLQAGFDDLRRTVRYAVEDNVQRALLTAARLTLSQRRQQLAGELNAFTTQRVRGGLQGAADELWTARDVVRAEADSARLQAELRQSVFTLLVLCDPQRLDVTTVMARTGAPGNNQAVERASVPRQTASAQNQSTPAAAVSLVTNPNQNQPSLQTTPATEMNRQ